MHAHVANAFLLGVREQSDHWDVYERERQTVTDTLAAAEQSSTSTGTLAQLRALRHSFGIYQDRIARAAENLPTPVTRARLFRGQAENYPVGLAYFREADTLIHQELLPTADRLAESSDASLRQAFVAFTTRSNTVTWILVVVGALTLLSYVGLQVFLARRTRRTFNPTPITCNSARGRACSPRCRNPGDYE